MKNLQLILIGIISLCTAVVTHSYYFLIFGVTLIFYNAIKLITK